MGIYEIIILVAAAVVFIIIIRRFPETANGDEMKINWLKIPKFKFAIPKIASIKLPQKTIDDDFAFNDPPKIVRPNEFAEPGDNLEEIGFKFPKLVQPLEEARKHFDMHQLDTAEKLYLQIAAEEPKCAVAYYKLGQIFLRRATSPVHKEVAQITGQPNMALNDSEEAFLQALKYLPGNGYILNSLGHISYLRENYNEAVKFYEDASNFDDKNAEWQADIGRCYLSLRQYSKAVRNFSKAWSLEPQNNEYKEMLDDAKDRERRLRTAR
jgi:tetratricopeptide (TPR) repeat protein